MAVQMELALLHAGRILNNHPTIVVLVLAWTQEDNLSVAIIQFPSLLKPQLLFLGIARGRNSVMKRERGGILLQQMLASLPHHAARLQALSVVLPPPPPFPPQPPPQLPFLLIVRGCSMACSMGVLRVVLINGIRLFITPIQHVPHPNQPAAIITRLQLPLPHPPQP